MATGAATLANTDPPAVKMCKKASLPSLYCVVKRSGVVLETWHCRLPARILSRGIVWGAERIAVKLVRVTCTPIAHVPVCTYCQEGLGTGVILPRIAAENVPGGTPYPPGKNGR
ncbi:hypothetical protein Bbelb_162410 [Branchiostoma belcheri]|nr:hypothetical protein Bbelb_162410 [Branchiostoma belcheri]